MPRSLLHPRVRIIPLLACAFALTMAASVRADPKPLSKEEQAKIDKAIEKAVAFVKKTQKETGEFGDIDPKLGHYAPYGYTFFPVLALLHSGVPPSDPIIQKVVAMVRRAGPKLDHTYDISLAILLLDQLNEPKDEKLIRKLALRLIAAQSYTGGWSYECHLLSEQNENMLWLALRDSQTSGESQPKPQKSGPPRDRSSEMAPSAVAKRRLKSLAIFQDPDRLTRFMLKAIKLPSAQDKSTSIFTGTTDNSNTQFAVLALWAASRHGVPVGRTLTLVVKRFEESQNEDGTWCYRFTFASNSARGDPGNNTAAALLGLATAYGVDRRIQKRINPEIQDKIIRGLSVLSKEIGAPTGQMERRVSTEPSLYFLWSVERLASLCKLSLLGEKDWYRWGAEILVTNQGESGAWNCNQERYFGSEAVRTSFGLLFLKKANFTRDLTAKLPLTDRELNKSIVSQLRTMEKSTAPSTGSRRNSPEPNRDP